jgi:hypothetical protein
MRRHKVRDSVGAVLISYVDNKGICHASFAISLQKTIQKRTHDISVIQEEVNDSLSSSWARSWARKKIPNIRKIAIDASDIKVDLMAKTLGQHYKLIALKMQICGRQSTWLNPELLQKIDEIKATRIRLDGIRNNGGKGMHFFEKTLRMQEAEVTFNFGENSQRLELELNNFSKPISLTW